MTPDTATLRAALGMCRDTFELLARECEDHDAATIAGGAARQIRALLEPATEKPKPMEVTTS